MPIDVLTIPTRDILESKADSETALPVTRRETAGFERHRRANYTPRIADHSFPEIESEYRTALGVVFNDSAKIDTGFCAGGPLRREKALPWFSNAEWITAKMNEAWSSLQEDSHFLPTLSALHAKESL